MGPCRRLDSLIVAVEKPYRLSSSHRVEPDPKGGEKDVQRGNCICVSEEPAWWMA